jgi:hypothetical protein
MGRELHDPLLGIELRHTVDRGGPGIVDHDQRVGVLIQPAEVARAEVEAALDRDVGFVPLGPVERGQDAFGIEILGR